ncbi:MAG: DUF4290 domain-containing protein [Bacteroidales bacterium]|nr:DUF4290 domain-containing protein [Bacteroidales bacterium]MCF8390756.1 DUF4290 domain-containing protein [Bacteroidales bacterium]
MVYDYNTSRENLILPEYGRNIQKMIAHIGTIEDRAERNKAAMTIIGIMGNLNPHLRDVGDYKHKLWDHLAIISEFKLDIDSPYDTPEPSKFQSKPNKIEYNQNRLKFKHYGKAVGLMLGKAAEMEEGEEKTYLISLLANHLKKSYLTWNREAVENEQILKDLKLLSKGTIALGPDDVQLNETRDILHQNRKKPRPQRKSK